MDIVDKETRSRMMSGIRGKDTKPEIAIRKALHARGYRYRINRRSLPGSPDIVLRKHRAVILVHGCFWHGHDCALFKLPSTRREFWTRKIGDNRARDERNTGALRALGWRICVVWECALRGRKRREKFTDLIDRLEWWLGSDVPYMEIVGDLSGDRGFEYSIEEKLALVAETPPGD